MAIVNYINYDYCNKDIYYKKNLAEYENNVDHGDSDNSDY